MEQARDDDARCRSEIPSSPPASSSARVRANRSASKITRCPFCHETLDAELEAWTQCAACGALEHRACWSEHMGCATCGGAMSTSARAPSRPRRSLPQDDTLARVSLLGALFVVLLVVGAIAWEKGRPVPTSTWEPHRPTADELAAERAADEHERTLAREREKAAVEAARRQEAVARRARAFADDAARRAREAEELARIRARAAREAEASLHDHDLIAPGGYWEHERAADDAVADQHP